MIRSGGEKHGRGGGAPASKGTYDPVTRRLGVWSAGI